MPEDFLKLNNLNADLFVPDGMNLGDALKRVTHLGVAAHPDDLEIMALDGILKGFEGNNTSFGGVICSSGSGSPRSGKYALYTDDEIAKVRREEQREAAVIGQYGALIQLGYESAEILKHKQGRLEQDLISIFTNCHPEVVYTHNPADRHRTHLAIFWATLHALRKVPPSRRPKLFYGCECWRDLDWMPGESKVSFDVSKNKNLAEKLIRVYHSQIEGGKNYVAAIMGRWAANATFCDPFSVDKATAISNAMDLTPLIIDDGLDAIAYVAKLIENFKGNVIEELKRSNYRES